MVKRGRAPILSAASSSALACAAGQMRIDCRPPRRDSSGSAASAGSAPPKWLMSSRKVTGPTLSLRINRRHASRWAASSGACGSGAGVSRVRASGLRSARLGGRAGANLALLAGKQTPDVGVVLAENENGYDQDEQQAGLAEQEIVDHDGDGGDQRRQRGIAPDHGGRRPHQAEQDAGRPMQGEQRADVGGHPLAAVEAQPHGEQVAEEGAEAGDVGELERLEGDVALGHLVDQQHGKRALQRIEQQRRGGEALAAGAQHVGGADVAGADVAHVAEARGLRQQQAEGNGAQEIAGKQRQRRIG